MHKGHRSNPRCSGTPHLELHCAFLFTQPERQPNTESPCAAMKPWNSDDEDPNRSVCRKVLGISTTEMEDRDSWQIFSILFFFNCVLSSQKMGLCVNPLIVILRRASQTDFCAGWPAPWTQVPRPDWASQAEEAEGRGGGSPGLG